MKILGICILMLLSVSFVSGQEVVDRIKAVVDEEIILESEINLYVQNLALQNRTDPMIYLQNDDLKDQILQELIDHMVLLAIAKEDTYIVVEDREVKHELELRLEMLVNEVSSEAKLEEIYGMPMRDIRREFEKNIRENLLVDRLRQIKLSGVKVSRSEVEEFFQEHKDQFSQLPETVELAHILLKIEPSESAEQRALALIDSIRQAAVSGEDFKALAKIFSQDPGSAAREGLLGWTMRGEFVPEFEEVAFALKPGEISQPVKTKFGYHVIKLNERKGEKINASHILIKLEPTSDDKERVMAVADSLYNMLLGGADFAALASEYSQDEQTANDGGDLGKFALAEMMPIYAERIKELEEGEFTLPFQSGMGIQILKVLKHQKPRELTLGKDWEQISRMALNWKQEQVYREWVDKLKEKVYIEIR